MKWVSVILVSVGCLGDGEETATDEATDKSVYQKQQKRLTKGLQSSQMGSRLMTSQNLSVWGKYIQQLYFLLILEIAAFNLHVLIKTTIELRQEQSVRFNKRTSFISWSGFTLFIKMCHQSDAALCWNYTFTCLLIKEICFMLQLHRCWYKFTSAELWGLCVLLKDTSEGHAFYVPSAEMENESSEMLLGSLYSWLCEA